jgi:hypothetical protein
VDKLEAAKTRKLAHRAKGSAVTSNTPSAKIRLRRDIAAMGLWQVLRARLTGRKAGAAMAA